MFVLNNHFVDFCFYVIKETSPLANFSTRPISFFPPVLGIFGASFGFEIPSRVLFIVPENILLKLTTFLCNISSFIRESIVETPQTLSPGLATRCPYCYRNTLLLCCYVVTTLLLRY